MSNDLQNPNRNATKKDSRDDNRKWMYIGAILLTVVTKYKTLIPLLSKLAVPVLTMLVSLFAYAWATSSWGVGLGIVAMLFIHELGHVLAAKRKGLPVSMPVFIPFLGALITLKKNPRDAVTEAYVAIGGPILGTLGALVAYLLGIAWESPMLLVIAYFGFFVNLINLLPIHPLDGGRIATAVTRWLWVVGLIGGLLVIVYLQSLLFFIIWAMFAYELYSKYVSGRKKKPNVIPFQIQIPIEFLRMQGAFVPGEQHQRELDFVTYSDRERNQWLEVYWESLGIREKINFQQQMLVKSVRVTRTKHQQDENGMLTRIVAQCEIVATPFENERYYDVSREHRWSFGFAYVGLAISLLLLMMSVHAMEIPGL